MYLSIYVGGMYSPKQGGLSDDYICLDFSDTPPTLNGSAVK